MNDGQDGCFEDVFAVWKECFGHVPCGNRAEQKSRAPLRAWRQGAGKDRIRDAESASASMAAVAGKEQKKRHGMGCGHTESHIRIWSIEAAAGERGEHGNPAAHGHDRPAVHTGAVEANRPRTFYVVLDYYPQKTRFRCGLGFLFSYAGQHGLSMSGPHAPFQD